MKKQVWVIVILLMVIAVGVGVTIVNYRINSNSAGTSGKTDASGQEDDSNQEGESDQTETSNTDFSRFIVTDLAGNAVDESILKGHKITLINVWGTYCGPCIEEMPFIEKIANEYAPDLQVLGICIDVVDGNGEIDNNMIDIAEDIAYNETEVTYKQLVPSYDMLTGVFSDLTYIPATYIVDENGKILENFVGGRSEDDFREIVERYIK